MMLKLPDVPKPMPFFPFAAMHLTIGLRNTIGFLPSEKGYLYWKCKLLHLMDGEGRSFSKKIVLDSSFIHLEKTV